MSKTPQSEKLDAPCIIPTKGTVIVKLLGKLPPVLIIPIPSDIPPAIASAPLTVLEGDPKVTTFVLTLMGIANPVVPEGTFIKEIIAWGGVTNKFPPVGSLTSIPKSVD